MDEQKKEMIFTPAREAIHHSSLILFANHKFTYGEVAWRAKLFTPTEKKEDSEITFIFSTRIKDILEEQHARYAKNESLTCSQIGTSSQWKVTVKAMGIESYYVARLLHMGVSDLSKRKREQEILDRKLINMYIGFARNKSMGMPKRIHIDSEGGMYLLTFLLENEKVSTLPMDIDALCCYIGKKFKGCIEF